MKAGIHPLYVNSKVLCACGNTFETRSTKELIKLEICSACHPFFTGQQKLIDTAGRVERFKKRFARTDGAMVERKPVAVVKMRKLESVKPAKKVLRTTPTTAPAKPGKGGKSGKKKA